MSDYLPITETVSESTRDLDLLPTSELVRTLAAEHETAVRAVLQAGPAIAAAVEAVCAALERGGRLVYAGAGTSGRLGYLDAAELPPTFSWPPERALALMAGGSIALTEAVEGAEDDGPAAIGDLKGIAFTGADALIAIAASGTTPYALEAALYATSLGAVTVGIANSPGAPLLKAASFPILLDTGPEAISGSTRLKAGTAQKVCLNTLSSAVMVRLGKVYGNLMVDLRASNIKLRRRAIRLTARGASASEVDADAALQACDWQVKTAILMLRRVLNAEVASAVLQAHAGRLRDALDATASY